MGSVEVITRQELIKSCGKAHAYCNVCSPDTAKKIKETERKFREDLPSCHNCGKCDRCLNLIAPEGMKVCRKCRETKPIDAFYIYAKTGRVQNPCKDCSHVKDKKRCKFCQRFMNSKDHDTCKKCRKIKVLNCQECGKEMMITEKNAYCSAECKRLYRNRAERKNQQEHRLFILNHYSNGDIKCNCCGEREIKFLALDHINGGGHKQSKELGGGGFYSWLRQNSYPEGFQVLCHNCNYGRYLNGGICPHQETVV